MTMFPNNQRFSEFPKSAELENFPYLISVAVVQSHYPAHRHDYLEMSLVIDGEGYQLINGEKCPMIPGTCSFLLPWQVHEIFVTRSPLRLYNCMFGSELLFVSLDGRPGLQKLLDQHDELPAYVQLSDNDWEKMTRIAQSMLDEYEHQALWREDLIRHKLSEYLVLFDRFRRNSENEGRLPKAAHKQSIWPVIRYVHSNYREPLYLHELAQHFGMNRSRLSSDFKKNLGVGFVEFLHEVRIRHACSLLTSTDMSISEVALEVGFNSFKTFSRVFHDLKKMTPREYRNRDQGLTARKYQE